jgi:two-component system response regulator
MSAAQILLVDDDRDDIEIALRAVRRATGLDNVRIAVAKDGLDALIQLGVEPNGQFELHVNPIVVFLDLKMPRIDGWEVLRRLRADPTTKDLPIVVVSWSARREDIDRCYALGANSFLVKRATPGDPGRYFADAVRYWVELNRSPHRSDGLH